MEKKIKKALKEPGIFQYGYIDPRQIEFHPSIQQICSTNACRAYGKSWACPPAIGDTEICRSRCTAYSNAVVFSAKYDLEDSFDYEGMEAAGEAFRKLCDRFYDAAEGEKTNCLLLANGGCRRCEECTYPNAPCKMPKRLFLAFEGHGIVVSDVAKQAGINYINGKDTVTYLGALFYNR